MSNFKRLMKIVMPGIAAGACSLVLYHNILNEDKNCVHARSEHEHDYKWDANWDRRNPRDLLKEHGIKETDETYEGQLKSLKPKAVRHLFLIRHGQYNLSGTIDSEKYLTPLGREQAEYAGKRLREINFPYTALHKSTMTRAQETGEIILKCLKDKDIPLITNTDLLVEGPPIPPDPRSKTWRPQTQFYLHGPRIEAAFRKYFHRADPSQTKDSFEIIVCHANVIRYFVCRALQIPPEAWIRFGLHHCSITWIKISPTGRVTAQAIGDTGHIPFEACTRN